MQFTQSRSLEISPEVFLCSYQIAHKYGLTKMTAYNVKKDLPFHKNGIMHLFEGSCRFHQKDQICDAA